MKSSSSYSIACNSDSASGVSRPAPLPGRPATAVSTFEMTILEFRTLVQIGALRADCMRSEDIKKPEFERLPGDPSRPAHVVVT